MDGLSAHGDREPHRRRGGFAAPDARGTCLRCQAPGSEAARSRGPEPEGRSKLTERQASRAVPTPEKAGRPGSLAWTRRDSWIVRVTCDTAMLRTQLSRSALRMSKRLAPIRSGPMKRGIDPR